MRRALAVAAAAALVATAAGCASDDGTNADGRVEISFWQTDSKPRVDGMKAVIDAFQLANPDITVKQTVVPYDDFQTKVAAAVPAGTGPDAAMIYFGWAPLWSKSNFIASLPADVAATVDRDFVPFAQVTKLKDKQYAVPTSVRNFGLFYNTTLLNEAGWKAPPTTWEEFAKAAGDCTKRDGSGHITQAGYYLGFGDDGWNWLRPLIESFGGEAFSDDGKKALWNQGKAVDAWEYMLDFTRTVKSSSHNFYESELNAFAAGLTCMSPQLPIAIGTLRQSAKPGLNWAVAPMPAGPEGRYTTGSSWPLAMTTKAAKNKNVAAAVSKFLAYAATPEAQTKYTDVTGELPARKDMLTDPKYSQNPQLQPFLAQMDRTTGVLWADELAERKCLVDAYEAAVLGKKDGKAAIDEGTACDQRIRDKFFDKW